jgi:putative sigma-54 modulation protein
MAQKFEISAKNMEVTDRIKKYVEKKIVRLDRMLTDIEETRVDLSYLKSARSAADRHVAELTIRGKGYILRTEQRDADLFAAFDVALDKMQRQVERYKGKRNRGRGDGATAAEVVPEAPAEVETRTSSIVRRKSFTLVPMDENEAIEQMALLEHEDFFVFYNVSTNAINILYKRRDGNFGIIEPQIG